LKVPLKTSGLISWSVMVAALSCMSMQAQWTSIPVVAGPACVASGKWKGVQKTPVLTSADGHERMYGWLEWDRPGKWTGKRCEANWWVFASLDGGKFKPLMARQDFLAEGQQASLAVVDFSSNAQWAAADVMTTLNGATSHGYLRANLAEHTSCFGSAVKGLDGVREELTMGDQPWLQRLKGVRDDGWLQLSVHAGPSVAGAETHGADFGPGPVFEPCSGKVKLEALR
jgi:hypothetical protein